MTKWEEWLGLLPVAVKQSRTFLFFWVSTLPSFLALPFASWLLPEHSFVRDVLELVPWYAPPLVVALLWLLFGDVVRWHRMARETRRLTTSPLALIFNPDGCADCLSVPRIRLGVYNQGLVTAHDVHVYVESFEPGFRGKRELQWVGMNLGDGLTINRSSRDGHVHVEFLSVPSAQYELLIAPTVVLGSRTEVVLSVEGRDLAPRAAAIVVDTQGHPPIAFRGGGRGR